MNPSVPVKPIKPLMLTLAIVLLAGPAWGRVLLGAYQGWAAFRDTAPRRCYAIARAAGGGPGFVTVARFPGRERDVRVRLGRPAAPDRPVRLTIDDRVITLSARGAEARAAGPRASEAIIAAMRGGATMRIDATAANGRPFRDLYHLGGAASAIDAATLGCPR